MTGVNALQDAERVVIDYIGGLFPPDQARDIAINTAATVERPYGWMFVYTTKAYLETRNSVHALMGAGPVLVLKKDGELIQFPSYLSQEAAVADYEAGASRTERRM